jgi:hypothetical protein
MKLAQVLAAAVLLGILVLAPAPANAWTRMNHGCTGGVYTDDLMAWGGNGVGIGETLFSFTERWVTRNPCIRGVQYVRALYRLYEFDGTEWVEYDREVTGWLRLYPGRAVRLPEWNPSIAYGAPYGAYIDVNWFNRYGVRKGHAGIDVDAATDYACGYVCHHWWHTTAGAGVMICAPCYSTWGGVLLD